VTSVTAGGGAGEPAQGAEVQHPQRLGLVVDEPAAPERPERAADVLAAGAHHACQVAVGEAQGDPGAAGRARLAVALGQAEQGLGEAALDVQGQQVVDERLAVGQQRGELPQQRRGGARGGVQERPEVVPVDRPGGGRRGGAGAGGPPPVGQQGQLADELAGPHDRVHLLGAAPHGGDDRDLAGGEDQHEVGGLALAHQKAARRVVERRRLGRQLGQVGRAAVAKHRAVAQGALQRLHVGLRPPPWHRVPPRGTRPRLARLEWWQNESNPPGRGDRRQIDRR
jgi:hypothetical protein